MISHVKLLGVETQRGFGRFGFLDFAELAFVLLNIILQSLDHTL